MRFTTKTPSIFVKSAVIIALFSIFIAACSMQSPQTDKKISKTDLLLNTVVTITVYSEKDEYLIDECFELCKRYEKTFSRTDPESELYRLNHAGTLEVSDELLLVLQNALGWCEKSGGAFDITLGAVSDLYGFSGETPHAPTPSQLGDALEHTGYGKIKISGNTVTLEDPEAVIDLGAIAKGYIADRLAQFLKENGCESAIINLGGNILCVGEKMGGMPFNVGIQYPFEDTQKIITNVSVRDMSVVTSGIYERSFVENGKLYHHILSPETGLPIESELLAVSIIGPSSENCDALSTVCFVLGLENGLDLINSLDGYEAVFVDYDYNLHKSLNFDKFTD